MKFTVKRSKWLRGEGYEHSYLLRKSDGKMCCLGFRALACGHTEDEVREQRLPSRWVAKVGVQKSVDITRANDTVYYPQREKKLKKLFAELGDKITFVD